MLSVDDPSLGKGAALGVTVVGYETRGRYDMPFNVVEIAPGSSSPSTSTDNLRDANVRLFDDVMRSAGDVGDYHPYPSGYGWTHIICASVAVTSIMLVIVLGNALVIVAVAVDRNLKGPQNWFIASLAVSDLLVGLFIMPLSLANELMGYWAFGSVLCQLWLAVDVMLCTASILNLCLISLDRYWSIVRAIAYLRQRTPRRAASMIGAVWILSAMICFPPLAGWSRPQPVVDGRPHCVLSEEPGYVIYSIVGSFYLPLGVMIAVYVKIYRAARWRARRSLATRNKASTSSGVTAESIKTSSMKTVDDEPCRSRQQLVQLEPGNRLQVFLSPGRKDDQQRSISSMEVDSELLDDQRHDTVEKTVIRRISSELESANDKNPIVGVQSEKTIDVVTNRHAEAAHRDDLVDAHRNCQSSSTRTSALEVSPANLASCIVQRCGDFDLSMVCDQRDNENGKTTSWSPDHNVIVVVTSKTESTRLAMTSSVSQNMTSSSAPSVMSSLPATIETHSASNNGVDITVSSSAKSRCFLTASGETKWLASSASTTDYQSTREIFDGTHSGREAAPSEDRGWPQKRRLRASWSSAGATTQRFRSVSSSGRRYPKSDGVFAETERAKKKAARARERRATIVLGIVMASFIGCWLPFFSVYPVALLTGAKVPGPLFGVIFWLGYCNSALNPIIYTVFNRDFRRAFQKIITEQIARCKSSTW